MKSRLLLIVLILGLASCVKVPPELVNPNLDAEANQRNSVQHLTYEHQLKVDTESSKVSILYDKTISICTSAESGKCILLDSSLSSKHDFSAYVKLRLQRDIVRNIIEAVSADGKVTEQRTHIEDLASSIADNNKRLQFLKSYQDKLIELQKQPNKEINSLVKIAKEIASVQSDIEQATGEANHLLNRINLDILTIFITSYGGGSFWAPISASLSKFSNNLSSGISDVVNAFAYFLPWLVILTVLLIVIKKLWRRKQA
jgi:hypothetical protein